MSRTPAAQLARLKVGYQSWDIRHAAAGPEDESGNTDLVSCSSFYY
jgi:hypothetical protein